MHDFILIFWSIHLVFKSTGDVINKGPAPLLHLLDYVVLIQQLYGLPGSSHYPSVLDRVSHKLAMHDMYNSSCLLQCGDITMQSRPAANCLSLLHILLIDDVAARDSEVPESGAWVAPDLHNGEHLLEVLDTLHTLVIALVGK